MKVLRGNLRLAVLPGYPRPGVSEVHVYIKLHHPKLPTGGVMFAMIPQVARAFGMAIVNVADNPEICLTPDGLLPEDDDGPPPAGGDAQ